MSVKSHRSLASHPQPQLCPSSIWQPPDKEKFKNRQSKRVVAVSNVENRETEAIMGIWQRQSLTIHVKSALWIPHPPSQNYLDLLCTTESCWMEWHMTTVTENGNGKASTGRCPFQVVGNEMHILLGLLPLSGKIQNTSLWPPCHPKPRRLYSVRGSKQKRIQKSTIFSYSSSKKLRVK